ncbi:MAG: helix-turn-helix domain-containing protein [Paracoccus sp. (in: a-proteobacteria)]
MNNTFGPVSAQPQHDPSIERALNLLIETTHDLSRTLSLHELMKKIVCRARDLVGSHLAWVTTLDEGAQVFRNLATEGHLSPGTERMTATIDRGAVSVVMATNSFFATQDYLSDPRFTHSEELDRQFKAERIMSLAGFPILSEGKVQGLLFVAERYARHYTGREVSVLGSFALHAGVAMRNAENFAQLTQALAEAEQSRRSLEDHISRVEISAHAHDEMMSLLSQGADLSMFMRRMAALVDGAIHYLDDTLTVRDEVVPDDYDGGLVARLRQGTLDQARILSAIASSRAHGRAALVQEDNGERCLALTLHSGSGRGDSLIVCLRGPVNDIQMRNLERSAVALSIAKLWTERRETERQIASSTLLRHLALVAQPDQPTIAAVRDRLKLGPGQPVQLALIALTTVERATRIDAIRHAGSRLDILVDAIDDHCLVIGTVNVVEDFVAALSRAQPDGMTGGLISEPFADLEKTADHYRRVARAMQVMLRLSRLDRFLPEREVSLFARLFETADLTRIGEFVADRLAPIERRDPQQRARLKATLLAYFDNQHSIARTAAELGIHVNTARQRLDSLAEATGGWRDPITAMELHVALRLNALSIGEPTPTHLSRARKIVT